MPRTLAIDEHGIVRLTRAQPETIEEEFLNLSYEKPENLPSQPSSSSPPDLKQLKAGTSHGTGDAWRAYGDGLFLWGEDPRLVEAITAYQQAIRLNPEDADVHFRLGVSYRRRYDSDLRQSDDFQTAVNHWVTRSTSTPTSTSGGGAFSSSALASRNPIPSTVGSPPHEGRSARAARHPPYS